jgi:site-specific DNA-methyltransferase (adenine-specific)
MCDVKEKFEKNKVYFGDCLEVMNIIPNKSVDLIFCDLPYGTTKCKWDSVIDLKRLWLQYERIIKDNGAILLTAQTPFDKILGASNLKYLRYEWIWEKTQATGHLNAKKMPMKAHENVLVFYKKSPIYNPIKTTGHKRKVSTAHHKRNTSTGEIYGKCDNFKDYDSVERYPRSVQIFASDKQKQNLFSTQKPLSMVEYFIKTYSNKGNFVLDNASGSGTTGLACQNLERGFMMIDNDYDNYILSVKRVGQQLPENYVENNL